MRRRRHASGVLALLIAVLGLLVVSAAGRSTAGTTSGSTSSAPTDGEALAVAESAAAGKLSVTPTTDLPASGASITVTGSGFDPANDLYIAVCTAAIKPSDDLTDCVDGVIPDENTGKAWALLTDSPSDKKKNTVAWGANGTFTVPLTIDAATSSSVDCVNNGCVVIARSAGGKDSRPKDITVQLTFAQPTTTTPPAPAPDVPATIGPDSVGLATASTGDQQTVVFTGFTPGEDVAVTLFSDPISVPNIMASESGIVTITFKITADLLPGQHTVQAIGSQSRTVGIARFSVVAAPVTTSAVASSSVASSSAAPSSSAPETTTSAQATTSTTTPVTTTSSALPVATSDSGGQSLWWLWVTLGLVLILGAATGLVAVARRRAALLEQDRLEQERLEQERLEQERLEQERLDQDQGRLQDDEPSAAQAADSHVWPPDQPWQTGTGNLEDPDQAGGLLSGRGDLDGPALYSGQSGHSSAAGYPRYEEPTSRIPTPPPVPGRPVASPPVQRTPATNPPVPDPGPGTAAWTPFQDDDEDDDPTRP